MTYYELDPFDMPHWTNLGHDWDLGVLVSAGEQGVRMLPDVTNVFFFRPWVLINNQRTIGPLKLRPDFAVTWQCFVDLVTPLVLAGSVEGFFLGDELLWQGALIADIKSATSTIRATSFGGMEASLIIYANEAKDVFETGLNNFHVPIRPDAAGNATQIHVSELGVTHISVDWYAPAQVTENYYKTFIYPRMTPTQKAFIVPQSYISTKDPWETCRQAITATLDYLEWARRDPRIVGINPWHWFSYGNFFGCTGDNTIGALDATDLGNLWRGIGADIVSNSKRPRLPERSLPMVHRFSSFLDGAALPTTFSVDPDGRGGFGLSDPVAPSVNDVCFSSARDGRSSIMMKHPNASFRYSCGAAPRIFEGHQWISPRVGLQIFRLSVWIDPPISFVAFTIEFQFGAETIVKLDFANSALLQNFATSRWNSCEVQLDLNRRICTVALEGVSILETELEIEQCASEVLIQGGPVFLSEFELRVQRVRYARSYRNLCQAMSPVESILLKGARIVFLCTNGDVYAKDLSATDLAAYLMWESTGVAAVALEEERIGVLANDGTVFVKQGALDAQWTQETTQVSHLALSGKRIGVIQRDGSVYVKENSLHAGWERESSGVASLILEGNRIAVLLSDGNVFVKEGPLNAEWTWESQDVASIVLNGTRIGIIQRNGDVYVKEGALDAEWTRESNDVVLLVLESSRIGILQKNGNVYVKEGALNAEWTLVSSDVKHFALAGSRLGVLKNDGRLFVKEGPLSAAWIEEGTGVRTFCLDGSCIAVLSEQGLVFVRRGPLNAPRSQLNGLTVTD